MQRSPYRFLALRSGAVVLAAAMSAGLAPQAARAAELGDVVVRSHLGQPLAAEIELVMLTPEDQAGVQARLAGPNIYQGANVRMHPALSSLRMAVVKRDNRQFLTLATMQPLDAEVVHLYLELGTGNRANVRSATLWLTPDPAPARAAASPAAISPAPATSSALAAPAAGPSAAERAAQEAQAAANRAAAIRAARMRAAANAARDAASDTGADSAAVVSPATPSAKAPAKPPAAAAAEVKPGPPAERIKLGPEPRVAKSRTGAARAGVCAPGQTEAEAQQCVALDQTNAELKTKLVDLEGKVKQLQAALGQGGAATAAAPGAAAPEAANKAGTVIPPSTPAKANGKKKKEPGGINTTALVVGGVLLLALFGGLAAYLIRRKKIKFSTAPLKVWQGWRKDKKPAEPEAAAEAIPEKE